MVFVFDGRVYGISRGVLRLGYFVYIVCFSEFRVRVFVSERGFGEFT